jgi:5,10-methenyltetrahydrofolate synthetase
VRPTIFYYNPNIWPREEYEIRKEESKRHAESLGVSWIDGDYEYERWRQGICGLENQPERGTRCEECFTMRLTATARKARELGIRYFATTLASSRWKSLEQINRAGKIAEQAVGQHPTPNTQPPTPIFWAQNWRKGGLQERRNQLLKEYGFYNQQYCGCEFSAHSVPTKTVLRQQMRKAKEQHRAQLAKMSAEVVERLAVRLGGDFDHENGPQILMAYWPLMDEVDIRPLTEQLVGQGRTVLLPKVTGPETMELRRYTGPGDLKEGAFHIMEPTGELFTDNDQIDVVLVPGMAFDAAGHRLGRGKGYYDRFLESLSESGDGPLILGVCFPFQRVAKVPTEEHDVVMDEVVS